MLSPQATIVSWPGPFEYQIVETGLCSVTSQWAYVCTYGMEHEICLLALLLVSPPPTFTPSLHWAAQGTDLGGGPSTGYECI